MKRLIRKKNAVLAFAFNQEVPFTNNLAERDIRPAKVKMKVSNFFPTFEGADIHARIARFVSTAREQDDQRYVRSVFESSKGARSSCFRTITTSLSHFMASFR